MLKWIIDFQNLAIRLLHSDMCYDFDPFAVRVRQLGLKEFARKIVLSIAGNRHVDYFIELVFARTPIILQTTLDRLGSVVDNKARVHMRWSTMHLEPRQLIFDGVGRFISLRQLAITYGVADLLEGRCNGILVRGHPYYLKQTKD